MLHQPQAILTDIEGTTTPISFVHDILFPYVRTHLSTVLASNDPALLDHIDQLRQQAQLDASNGIDVPLIPPRGSPELSEAVISNIQWQMDNDRKVGALKAFQGWMWKDAYKQGTLQGIVYPDVVAALQRWQQLGIPVYVYSSGSVAAQKLLFGHSDHGDLLKYFSGYYDTTVGSKLTPESYTKIVEDMGCEPSGVWFLTDNIAEVEAAKEAGLHVLLAMRPGNHPIDEGRASKHVRFHSFDELF
jgi:enolase-phosphatase E1